MTKTHGEPHERERASDTEALAHGLIWLSNRLSARAVEAYRPMGLSSVAARVVKALNGTPSLHAAALSARIDVDPAVTSRTLKTLRVKGWVYLDERRRLALSEHGAQLKDLAGAVSDELYSGLTLGFSEAERRQLVSYLQRMRKNFSALPLIDIAGDARFEELR